MRRAAILTLALVMVITGMNLARQPEELVAQTTCNPTISHFEFTQSIQKGNPHNGDPALEAEPLWVLNPPQISLVDDRAITVRTYVDCDGCTCAAGELGGSLQLFEAGGGSTIFSGLNHRFADNLGDALAHDAPWNREDENETLNFTFLPGEGASNDRQVAARVCVGKLIESPSGGSSAGVLGVEETDCKTQTVSYYRRKPVEIWGYPIEYEGLEPLGASYAEGYAESMILDAHPVPARTNYTVKQMPLGLQEIPRGFVQNVIEEGGGVRFEHTSNSIGLIDIDLGGTLVINNLSPAQVTLKRYSDLECGGAFSTVTLEPAGDPSGDDTWTKTYNSLLASCAKVTFDGISNPSGDEYFKFEVTQPRNIAKVKLNPISRSDYDLGKHDGREQYAKDLNFFKDNTHPAPDLIYSWFAGGSLGSRTGSAIVGAGLGGDDQNRLQGSFAHEFVHMISSSNHTSGENIDEVGFNVLDRLQLGRVQILEKHNLYRDHGDALTTQRWIDTETYSLAYSELLPPASPPGFRDLPPEGDFIALRGVVPVTATDRVAIYAIDPIRNHVATSPDFTGDIVIRLIDVSGSEMYTTTMHSPAISSTYYYELVPCFSQLDEVRIQRPGGVQTSVTRTLNTPVVSILYPTSGSDLTNTYPAISWSASDADGDQISTTVLYSHDGGVSWTPVASLDGALYWSLEGLDLPSSDGQGALRVIASDGLNWSYDEVGGLSVGTNHAPRVVLVSPRDGDDFIVGSNVPLQARYSDAEDGWLNGNTGEYVPYSVLWQSDLDGVLGSTQSVNTTLSSGTHVVSVTVLDSDGLSATESVTVTVGSP